MATATAIIVRGDRCGRAVLRLAVAAMLVLLVLGATIGAAGAETWGPINTPSLTKEEFIQGCLESKGVNIVTEYPEKNTVLCEHEDGSWSYCNFNPPILCSGGDGGFYPDPDQQTPGTHGTVGGGTATTGGATDGTGPLVVRPRTVKPGTILLLDDDERP